VEIPAQATTNWSHSRDHLIEQGLYFAWLSRVPLDQIIDKPSVLRQPFIVASRGLEHDEPEVEIVSVEKYYDLTSGVPLVSLTLKVEADLLHPCLTSQLTFWLYKTQQVTAMFTDGFATLYMIESQYR